MKKNLILFLLTLIMPIYAKLYPVYIKDHDRLTEEILKQMADGVDIVQEPNGCSIHRDFQYNSPIIFYVEPAYNALIGIRYRFMPGGVDTFKIEGYGEYGSNSNQFNHPLEVVSLDGENLYVLDSYNNRIKKLFFNLQNYSFTTVSSMAEYVGLDSALGLCLNENSSGIKLYVADTKKNRIVRIADGASGYEATFGSFGSGVGQFKGPHDLVKHDDYLYIADTYNQRIVTLLENPDGSFSWINSYALEADYPLITSIDCDQNGNVYCVDKVHNKILKFNEGLNELLWSIGSRGVGNSQFLGPRAICVSKECSDVIVVESFTDLTGMRFLSNHIDIIEKNVIPAQFDATIPNEQSQISFKIDDVARVYVEILEGGNHVRWMTPAEGLMLSAGTHDESFLIWDGTDDAEDLCLPGEYIVKITAADAYDNTTIKTIPLTIEGSRVTGTLEETAHWTLDYEPYVLIGDVRIAPHGRLEIDPGVKVMPAGNYGILPPVHGEGSIFARGSALSKILFTPHRKLYLQPDEIPFLWKGIDFRIGAAWPDTLLLDHCIIEAAGSDSAAVWCKGAQYVRITNTEIHQSGRYGLYCDYQCDTVVVNNCQFKDNDSIPLIAAFKHIGEINGNNFSGNKPDVIGVTDETRTTDAVVANQNIPYWFLKRQTGEFKVMGLNSSYCPTLTIEPGVSIYFHDSTGLYAQPRGRILAQGTHDENIVFTALDPSQYWRGIHINNTNPLDTSRFESCEISYGGNQLTCPYDAGLGNLSFMTNTIAYVLKNCRISHSSNYGVGNCHGYETDTMVSYITHNTFIANDSFPLIISTTEFNRCDSNQFFENGLNMILVKNGGSINCSTLIKNQNAPYLIDAPVELNDSLFIEAGNIIQNRGYNYWLIKSTGVLKATDVTFTAYDAVWWGMKFDHSQYDTSILDNCLIEKTQYYGGIWPAGAVSVHSSLVRISNSAILNNEKGIYVTGQSSLDLTGNLISQNRCGLHTWDCAYLDIEHLRIRSNDFIGNKLAMQTNCWPTGGLDATNNWWGDATGPWDPVPGDPLYNPSGKGDSIGAHIDYEPWLTVPVHPVGVTLIQPNGGETLYSGSEYEIKWTRAVMPSRQELYYTVDYPEGGADGGKESGLWRFIDTVRASDVSFQWRVPNTASPRCRVAIWIYYYAKEKTGAGRELSLALDISDANFTVPVTTDFSSSTAYNTSRKILTSPAGNRVYFVYANEGLSLPAGIYYCYSSDSGRSFNAPMQINPGGVYPALGINHAGNPCAAWVSGSNIYYSHWGASWVPPDTIVLPVENVSPVSLTVDNTDTVHLTFVKYYELPSNTGDLLYVKFPYAEFQTAVYETLLIDSFCKTPSIVTDQAGNLHLLWQGRQCLCYRVKEKGTSGWSDIDTIYTTITNENESLYPAINSYGLKITAVWQDHDELGNWEIFSRRKADIGWDEIKQVSMTLGESRFPVLAGTNYCLWQDNSSGNWDIYKSEYVDINGLWTIPENISNSPVKSTFPHGAYALVDQNTAKLYCLWTEGDTIPYTIEYEQLSASLQPIIFCDIGQPVQSPYCLSRDGYWSFGEKPYESVDWADNELIYRFAGLDHAKQYRLDLSYYFENSPAPISKNERLFELSSPSPLPSPIKGEGNSGEKGIGRIIQALIVDSLSLDTSFITPNKLQRISVWLPIETYADGEITGRIEKIKGKIVVCGEIALFEFGQDEKEAIVNVSGPMGEEAIISQPSFVARLYPNPVKGILKIRCNSLIEHKVTMQVFDASGRQVLQREFIVGSKKGISEVVVPLDGISAGVYFVRLESVNYEMIEKVILIK